MSRWFQVGPLPTACLLLSLVLTSDEASGQPLLPTGPVLPSLAKLSDIEIRLAYESHGGCLGRCIRYAVAIRGEGIVEYEDLGGAPRDRPQQRTIPVEEVVSLVDAFIRARFFEALDKYDHEPVARREGNSIRFLESGSADGPEWDLTFRVGTQVKTVHLYMGFPAEFGRLRDLVERIGGPKAWTPQ